MDTFLIISLSLLYLMYGLGLYLRLSDDDFPWSPHSYTDKLVNMLVAGFWPLALSFGAGRSAGTRICG